MTILVVFCTSNFKLHRHNELTVNIWKHQPTNSSSFSILLLWKRKLKIFLRPQLYLVNIPVTANHFTWYNLLLFHLQGTRKILFQENPIIRFCPSFPPRTHLQQESPSRLFIARCAHSSQLPPRMLCLLNRLHVALGRTRFFYKFLLRMLSFPPTCQLPQSFPRSELIPTDLTKRNNGHLHTISDPAEEGLEAALVPGRNPTSPPRSPLPVPSLEITC